MLKRFEWIEGLFFCEDPEICRMCKGACCCSHPGMYLDPERFFSIYNVDTSSWESFLKSLNKHYLETKLCLGVPIPVPMSNEKGCVFLGKDGCVLPRERRPSECLLLIPNVDTLIEGEIKCFHPRNLRYRDFFEKWRKFYLSLGFKVKTF